MSNMTETTTITLELTTEQVEFLEWAAKLEGITPEQYLLRIAEGNAGDGETRRIGIPVLSMRPTTKGSCASPTRGPSEEHFWRRVRGCSDVLALSSTIGKQELAT